MLYQSECVCVYVRENERVRGGVGGWGVCVLGYHIIILVYFKHYFCAIIYGNVPLLTFKVTEGVERLVSVVLFAGGWVGE